MELGWDAKSALKHVIEDLVTQFEAMQDPYIKERAVDVKDLRATGTSSSCKY